MDRWISLVGIFVFLFICYLFSSHKKQIDVRLVIGGMLMQFVLALLVLGIPALGINGPLRFLFDFANDAVVGLLNLTTEGSRFVFGSLVDSEKFGFIFAFQILPTIIFFSALMAVFYHLGIMQRLVNFISICMQKVMQISGAESLSTAANIFLGQTEAPLLIKPFIDKMTRSELICIMIGGMANVAGGVLAAYVGLLKARIPDIAGHLLTCSVLSAPATIVISKILIPETEKPETLGEYTKLNNKIDHNVIEAAARGSSEGLSLALNVAAMLIGFIALIAGFDAILKHIGYWIHFQDWGQNLVPPMLHAGKELTLSFSVILGWLFSPLAFFMGVPYGELSVAGSLLGEKVFFNEFVAYLHLSEISAQLSDRAAVLMSYALCGFANFSSIAIQIGGIGSLAPNRRSEIAQLGLKAVLGGTTATFLTACIAGLLI